MNKRYLAIRIVLLALGLTGCSALRSPYQAPQAEIPACWQQTVTGQAVAGADRWWQAFGDPQLDALIDQVLRRNNDLAVAGIKLRKARLQADLSATNQTPDLAVTLNSQTSRALDSGQDSTQNHALSASASYEVDLWGRLASARDAARWEADATAQDKAATALSLIGSTASLYWQIAYLNETLTLGEASLADTRRALELSRVKYRAGAIGSLDLLQAEQDVATQEAALTTYRQQLVENRNALAILFDAPPEQWQTERKDLHDIQLPQVAAGVPAQLLSRRPDLRASELRLRSSLAEADSTRLSLYPVFSLTATGGSESRSLSHVLSNPVGTLGAGLTLPFVNWHQQQLNVQIADSDYEQAVVAFRQSWYQALGDVENALNARIQYQAQAVQLQKALDLARHSERLAEVRYRAGTTGVQDWLDEQAKRRTAEQSLAQNRLNQLNNQMALYQALGGADKVMTASSAAPR